jgi:cation:H+ antiporter
MNAPVMVWLEFALCAGLIGSAGPVLVRYGDIIARRTGLSRTWIGLVLLATATSLPELLTGISSVTFAAAPNIAVGDALGSCVLNLAMLVIVDGMYRGAPLYSRVDQGHILSAGFGIILIGLVGAAILLGRNLVELPIARIGAYTPLIVILYFVAMRSAYLFERRKGNSVQEAEPDPGVSLGQAVSRYLGAAAIVVVAGTWLPFIGVEIAELMGVGTTFVGTLLIAGATSLPELVVVVSAVRVGALDLATANLLGSNLFDMLILAIDDVAYAPEPLLSAVSPAHAVTAFAAVTMTGTVIVAILYRPATRLWGTVGWVSLALLMTYLLSAYAIYLERQ